MVPLHRKYVKKRTLKNEATKHSAVAAPSTPPVAPSFIDLAPCVRADGTEAEKWDGSIELNRNMSLQNSSAAVISSSCHYCYTLIQQFSSLSLMNWPGGIGCDYTFIFIAYFNTRWNKRDQFINAECDGSKMKLNHVFCKKGSQKRP